MLNVVDGCVPSDLGAGTTQKLVVERRPLYVAMTRARDSLALITPQRFLPSGRTCRVVELALDLNLERGYCLVKVDGTALKGSPVNTGKSLRLTRQELVQRAHGSSSCHPIRRT